MAIASQRLTLEAFLRLPEQEPALEFWHGEVTQKVPPMGPHGAVQYGLGRRIDDDRRLRQLFRVFTETRVIFTGVSTVPDLVVYRRERVPRDARGEVAEYFTTRRTSLSRSPRRASPGPGCSRGAAGTSPTASGWPSWPIHVGASSACSAPAVSPATSAAPTCST